VLCSRHDVAGRDDRADLDARVDLDSAGTPVATTTTCLPAGLTPAARAGAAAPTTLPLAP
jgi:hypothetical protein